MRDENAEQRLETRTREKFRKDKRPPNRTAKAKMGGQCWDTDFWNVLGNSNVSPIPMLLSLSLTSVVSDFQKKKCHCPTATDKGNGNAAAAAQQY